MQYHPDPCGVVGDRKLRNTIEHHNSLLPEYLDCGDSFCEAEGYLGKVPVLLHDKLDHRRRGGLSDLGSHDNMEWCFVSSLGRSLKEKSLLQGQL